MRAPVTPLQLISSSLASSNSCVPCRFLFKNISPYFWSSLGIGLCVGLSIGGAAWCAALENLCPACNAVTLHRHDPPRTPCRGIFITGSSLLGAATRVPRITSKNLIRLDQHGACLHHSP